MDTTETYIKMSDCPEIQEQWKRNTGDWAINFHCHSNFYATVVRIPYIVTGQTWDKDIWLPRQDQLQEMVADYIAKELEHTRSGRGELMQAFIDFSVWLGEQYHNESFVCNPTNTFDSGEQLWLAFVMKEKFGKVWSDGEWVQK